MRTTVAIARQQLRQLFGGPLAWGALALFLAWLALTTLWVDDVLLAGISSLRRPLFWMAAGFTVLAPALTMRSIAEDRRSGALQLVGTWPIGPGELVVGRWLGAVGVLAVGLALTAPWPLALAALGPLDPGPVAAGYAAVLLFGAACAAVGVAASAWTSHQVLAFLAAFALLLAPWSLGLVVGSLPAGLAWLEWLTPQLHLDRLIRGVVDLRSVVALASVAAVALRVAVLALEHERLG